MFLYVLLLNHHQTKINTYNNIPLCLIYHFFSHSTTTYLNFLFVHPLFMKYCSFLIIILRRFLYGRIFKNFTGNDLLRGLTEHTLKNYCTYIRWLQKSRGLSDRTINCAISQLRFFTLYVLHKAWDDTQLPMRRFNQYLPYVPSKQETWQFISTIPDLKQKTMVTLLYSSGLRIGEVCRLRYEDVDRKNMRLHITHSKKQE